MTKHAHEKRAVTTGNDCHVYKNARVSCDAGIAKSCRIPACPYSVGRYQKQQPTTIVGMMAATASLIGETPFLKKP
jgi:hypothetical protein